MPKKIKMMEGSNYKIRKNTEEVKSTLTNQKVKIIKIRKRKLYFLVLIRKILIKFIEYINNKFIQFRCSPCYIPTNFAKESKKIKYFKLIVILFASMNFISNRIGKPFKYI